MSNKDRKALNLKLTGELFETIKAHADKDNRTMNNWAENHFIKYFKEKGE